MPTIDLGSQYNFKIEKLPSRIYSITNGNPLLLYDIPVTYTTSIRPIIECKTGTIVLKYGLLDNIVSNEDYFIVSNKRIPITENLNSITIKANGLIYQIIYTIDTINDLSSYEINSGIMFEKDNITLDNSYTLNENKNIDENKYIKVIYK